jgi:hypothetical protein
MADNIDWAIMIPTHPDHSKVWPVSVSANNAKAIKVVAFQSLEIQIIKNIAIDNQHSSSRHHPVQKPLQLLSLTDFTSKVQVADNHAIPEYRAVLAVILIHILMKLHLIFIIVVCH